MLDALRRLFSRRPPADRPDSSLPDTASLLSLSEFGGDSLSTLGPAASPAPGAPAGVGEPAPVADSALTSAPVPVADAPVRLPFLGLRPVQVHRRLLWLLTAVFLLALGGVIGWLSWSGGDMGSDVAGLLWRLSPVLLTLLATLSAAGLLYVQLLASRQRQADAERQRLIAERLQAQALAQEKEAKRINEATQAAILRLMDELQLVAEGDLTQQATVTEDITGAIADSINYTVEELRSLVGQVQIAAARAGDTTEQVESTSIELLAASTEQLREIRETGQSVLEMARRINDVSSRAQESAEVARRSLLAAESGLQAVQDSIGGMNAIRDQIQETAKRIKRLGESSQEIGEITELIAEITEQTNVLALNAAIQAASAGEAGRGFSVVAEEVQRLAERSADATRQIGALVKAIQTDTQDAVAAMEQSTRGVVEGAQLSDRAGHALSDIDRLSREVAALVEQITSATLREADLAGHTASRIQHIFAVTEQTGEGTRSTVKLVRELAQTADELRESVARFKIA